MRILHENYYLHCWVVFLLELVTCVSSLILFSLLLYYQKPAFFIYKKLGIHAQLILSLCPFFILILKQRALYDLVKIIGVRFLLLLFGMLRVF